MDLKVGEIIKFLAFFHGVEKTVDAKVIDIYSKEKRGITRTQISVSYQHDDGDSIIEHFIPIDSEKIFRIAPPNTSINSNDDFFEDDLDIAIYQFENYKFNEHYVCIDGIDEKEVIEIQTKNFYVRIAPVKIGPDKWVCDYHHNFHFNQEGVGSGASLVDNYFKNKHAALIDSLNYCKKSAFENNKKSGKDIPDFKKFEVNITKLMDKYIDELAALAKRPDNKDIDLYTLKEFKNALKASYFNRISINLPGYIVRLNDTNQGETPEATPQATMLANKKISDVIEYLKQDISEASPKRASTARKKIDTNNYPGAKGGSGVIQKIINQVPKGTVTIIHGCIGSSTFLKNILPAQQNIGIDIDENVINYLNANRGKEKLQHAELVQYDIIKYLKSLKGKRLDNESTFIYLDPPYPKSARRGQRDLYNFEMSDMDHVSLLSAITELKCRIAISTYENDLYKEYLKKWRLVKFNTTHRQGVATEFLYLNYAEPKQLHDTRYVGNNFRERERIKRKAKRWVSNLEEMPPLERQYIVELMKQKNLF